MKLTKRMAAPMLAFAMLATTGAAFAAAPAPAPAAGFYQGPWDIPPGEYRDYQVKGFRDGIEGAHRDAENHRPFTPENRDEYRHPGVPKGLYRDYRQAFREGYHRAVAHMEHGGPR